MVGRGEDLLADGLRFDEASLIRSKGFAEGSNVDATILYRNMSARCANSFDGKVNVRKDLCSQPHDAFCLNRLRLGIAAHLRHFRRALRKQPFRVLILDIRSL